jgi:ribosome-associated translation inhibitor RaiA
MNTPVTAPDAFEISPRFRQSLEERVARLERDATEDERMLAHLENEDHLRRHRRLIAVQRAEALRMRLFLDRARHRLPRPLIAL